MDIALAALRIVLMVVPELVDVLHAGKDAAPPHLRADLERMLPPKSKAEKVSEDLAAKKAEAKKVDE